MEEDGTNFKNEPFLGPGNFVSIIIPSFRKFVKLFSAWEGRPQPDVAYSKN